MSSDRARDSYDPSRKYTGVVAQQGRVTLEADINEQQRIASETLRKETLDIVGPCGTPDDGFAVKAGGTPPDFAVGPGTMYVGGLRVTAPKAINYANQDEWLDRSDDPLWVDPAKSEYGGKEFVYLFLREQEVSAVEDVPLREVALGGPDTAQRTRLVQRIVAQAVDTDQCSTALDSAEKSWAALGLTFDPKTMRLKSPATLHVKFVQPPAAATQCDPQVKGGYLGADNQMIRVQISGHDAKTKTWRLLWGYNDASFLHRVSAVGNSALKLQAQPIDSYHAPTAGQPVEVLRSAVDLKEDNYVAAPTGFVFTPTLAYVPDTQTLALPAGTVLPPNHVTDPQLFLRLWEEELSFTPGSPVDLTGTGLRVTIALNAPSGDLTVGQFWTFAVRPSTPVIVYPQRYLDGPQLPEGPRMWACPLAVIGFAERKFQLISDCRVKFDNLVDLTKRRSGCCSIVIKPEDVGGGKDLQLLLNSAGPGATVSLLPGTYVLPRPLLLTQKQHAGLTLEGCHDGAELVAAKGSEKDFLFGLLISFAANDITLRGLRFHLPLVPVGKVPNPGGPLIDTFVSLGVVAIHCANLSVEDCLFLFVVQGNSAVYAAAVRAASDTANLRLVNNRFLHSDDYQRTNHFLVGFMAGLAEQQQSTDATGKEVGPKSSLVPVLDNMLILGNEFGGLTLAALARGEIGRVRCDNNRVHGCSGGFYFIGTDQQFASAQVIDAFVNRNESDLHQQVYTSLMQSAQIPVMQSAYKMAQMAPLPAGATPGRRVVVGRVADSAVTKAVRAAAIKANAARYENVKAAQPAQAAQTGQTAEKAQSAKTKSAAAQPAASETSPKTTATTDKQAAEELRESMASYLTMPAAGLEPVSRTPVIRFGGNDIDIVSPVTNSDRKFDVSLFCLLTKFMPPDNASVMMTANDIRGQNSGYLVDLEYPMTATVTGNFILNAYAHGHNDSLLIDANSSNGDILISVTGNAFVGDVNLPSPLDCGCSSSSWDLLNSRR